MTLKMIFLRSRGQKRYDVTYAEEGGWGKRDGGVLNSLTS